MQAKKGKINKIINPNNAYQLDLYTNWPRFEYVNGCRLKNEIRHINQNKKDKDIDDGVKYLLTQIQPQQKLQLPPPLNLN